VKDPAGRKSFPVVAPRGGLWAVVLRCGLWRRHGSWPLRRVGGRIDESLGATKPVAGFSPLSPWAGLGLIAAYAAVLLIVSGWLLVRRDA